MIWDTITSVLGLGAGWLKGRQERQKAAQESKLRVHEAKVAAQIKKIETGQQADIAWENTSIENAGFKDEFWTIVLAIPMVLCFIPGAVQYVQAGFAALAQTPTWYQTLVGVAVGSAFGVRQFSAFKRLMKGE